MCVCVCDGICVCVMVCVCVCMMVCVCVCDGMCVCVGCTVETHKIAGNNMYMLRILPKMTGSISGRPALEVATENLEEILDWQKQIEDARNAIETHQHDLIKKTQVLMQQSRSRKIALEMSDLVIYCRPVPFALESE